MEKAFQLHIIMAKGKHAPNPGQVKKQDQVLHPNSRKLKKVHKSGIHRGNVEQKNKVGMQRMSSLADKMIWVKENLHFLVEEDGAVSKDTIFQLISGMLSRFDEELEQINLKKSIGKNRKNQHSNREDQITQTIKSEKSDFEGCGLELPDLLDPDNLEYFNNWNGELKFVQNIKLRRFKKSEFDVDSMET